jgi:serine/threonine protein kinase
MSGDAARDDALLLGFANVQNAAKPLLADREWLKERDRPAERMRHVAQAYHRWRRRGRERALTESERRVLGVLGFWLLTMRMLYYTTRLDAHGESTGLWPRRLNQLNRIFHEPAVRDAFAELYDFPRRHLALDSASIHRLGTTSFILRCQPLQRTAHGRASALKCLLYPYVGNTAIAEATRGYVTRYEAFDEHMAAVEASTAKWIQMEFIEGATLAEAMLGEAMSGERHAARLRVDLLRRLGLSLLDALADVPYPHMDLSPTNVIVRGWPDEVRIVLIDFGENYLLTHNVSSGSVSAETARYVAPELLRSRIDREATGYEDVYSAGQILLDLAGCGDGGGGYIPNDLFMQAPFLAHLVEDMVDEDPEKRLLLIESAPAAALGPARRQVYRDLRRRLQEALDAHEVLAKLAPTLMRAPDRSAPHWWQRARSRAIGLLGSLPMMLKAVREPLGYARVAAQNSALGTDYRYLFAWVFLGSVGWAAAWSSTIAHLWSDPAFGSLPRSAKDLVDLLLHPDRLGALPHRYLALEFVSTDRWESFLASLVVLSVGLAAARYYLEIFAPLTLRRLRRSASSVAVEALMRLTAVWVAPIVLVANLYVGRHWGLFGWVMVVIVANNYACWRLAAGLVHRGEPEFSTMRRSDLRHSIDAFSEWWKLMAAYGVVITTLGVLVELGLAHDLVLYSLVVIAVNMIKLYRSNSGKLAPGVRATLSRAFVCGERLQALERRRATAAQAPEPAAVTAPTPALT